MPLTRDLIMAILPKRWHESIKADSERWKLRCTTCNHTRSVWEAGGIRWKAYSKGKITMLYCPQCNTLRAHAVELPPE